MSQNDSLINLRPPSLIRFYLHQLPKTTLKMPQLPYIEDDVIEAMLDVTENGLSQHEAAQKHGMPHPGRLLSKSQEARLITWILRQGTLGYAPSHSQVRTTVATLQRQQGRERPIGVHWLTRFMKCHPSIKNKIGKRQEASRFNCFTPTAVNWYFNIREREYS
jgi:hypothetical protein